MWESVATISGPKGVEERQPRTDKEWAAVRANALLVIEGANMLLVEGRKVALPGQQLEDPGSKTDFTPAQAQAEIDKDRPAFVAFAHALQDAAGTALTAIEKRDANALLEAGGDLDEACENCHKRFWYPNSPKPPGA
jgi:Cytochrome C'